MTPLSPQPSPAPDAVVVHHLPLDLIDCRRQVRPDGDVGEDDLADLAASIREVGVQQPVRVRRDGDRFVLLVGHRRWRASKMAGRATIPALVAEAGGGEAETLQLQLVENLQRRDLSPLAQADGLAALMAASGCTAAEAARKISRSPATVSKLLSLRSLPPADQARVASGEVGLRAGHALARAMAGGSKAAPAAKPERRRKVTAVLDGNCSVTVTGTEATLEALQDAIERLLTRVKAAQRQGISMDTFLAVLRDEAKRRP